MARPTKNAIALRQLRAKRRKRKRCLWCGKRAARTKRGVATLCPECGAKHRLRAGKDTIARRHAAAV